MAFDFPNTPIVGTITTGPNGAQYYWDGTKWEAVSSAPVNYAPYGAINNVGRNLIHNALFNVQQRGTGPFGPVTNSYIMSADRWWTQSDVAGPQTTNIVALTDANRTAIGDEAAKFGLQTAVTGSATTNAANLHVQVIEDVRRLGGKTVVASFWAWAASGTPRIGCSLDQSFGTGGSPSAYVNGVGQSVAISTTPTRYSFTFTLGSTSGKTLGTNNDHATNVNFWLSGAANLNSQTGSVGVQTGTFTMWGVQLEVAQPGQTQPTSLEKLDPADDLRKCQRFYQLGYFFSSTITAAAGAQYLVSNLLPTPMRAVPTIAVLNNANSNVSGFSAAMAGGANVGGSACVYATGTSTAAGGIQYSFSFSASADL